jgi:ABC-2 type transport system permease protein
MFRILKYELIKTFSKKRTYLGFLVVALIVPLVEIAMAIEGGRYMQVATRSLRQDFLFIGNLFNGWFVAAQIMMSMWIHVPLLITFVAGDQFAGEATAGTYRLILIKPASRFTIFLTKLVTTLLYTILFVVFLAVLSIGLAYLLLGSGDLLVLQRGMTILPEAEVPARFLLAYASAMLPMITVATLALLFSSLVENAIGPIIGTMSVIIVFSVITNLPIELFRSIRPYLFTNYMIVWMEAFAEPIAWDELRTGLLWHGGYSFVFIALTWLVFRRKDILS